MTSRVQVRQYGADHIQLIVEILETEAIANFDTARKILRRIREFGGHFALDNFGIGFTSFEYLKSLGVDYGQGYYISRPLAAAPIGEVGREIEARPRMTDER